MNGAEKKLLLSGLAQLDIKNADNYVEPINSYILQIKKYGKNVNIIGTLDSEELIIKHVLDCVCAVPYFKAYKSIADIGSGAGFPGVLLALFLPSAKVFCIESKKKKADFIVSVKNELQLSNLTVINKNYQEVKKAQIKPQAITARAFGSVKKIIRGSRTFLSPRAKFILYKGQRETIDMELNELDTADSKKYDIIELKIPFLNSKRHLLILSA